MTTTSGTGRGRATQRGASQERRSGSRGGSQHTSTEEDDAAEVVNTVTLVGRVSAAPEARSLPSGDEVVSFRLIVPRKVARGGAGERRRVDVVDIACWASRTRRSARTLGAGDPVRVEGALRRRFFRSPGGATSRYEIEARSVRREGHRASATDAG